MDDARKTVGKRIRRDREQAGYRSQRAFAAAIGVDTTSVAYAETGDDRIAVGGKVFRAIERGLTYPEDSIARYLETGDQRLLPSADGPPAEPTDSPAEAALSAMLDWTTVTDQELVDARDAYANGHSVAEADAWLVRAVRLRNEARRQAELEPKDFGGDVGRSA